MYDTQCIARRTQTAKVIVQDGEDMMADPYFFCAFFWAAPFQTLAAPGPDIKVRICNHWCFAFRWEGDSSRRGRWREDEFRLEVFRYRSSEGTFLRIRAECCESFGCRCGVEEDGDVGFYVCWRGIGWIWLFIQLVSINLLVASSTFHSRSVEVWRASINLPAAHAHPNRKHGTPSHSHDQ